MGRVEIPTITGTEPGTVTYREYDGMSGTVNETRLEPLRVIYGPQKPINPKLVVTLLDGREVTIRHDELESIKEPIVGLVISIDPDAIKSQTSEEQANNEELDHTHRSIYFSNIVPFRGK